MLTLHIHPTNKIVSVNGGMCRVWEGNTPNGLPVYLIVAELGSANSDALQAVSDGMRAAGPLQQVEMKDIAAEAERLERWRV
jgi:hypothetical protein